MYVLKSIDSLQISYTPAINIRKEEIKMKLELTPDAASKRIKRLREELESILSMESECSSYTVGVDEVNPPDPPEYSFFKTQEKINWHIDMIVTLKHALNIFNSSTFLEIKGSPRPPITIDAALVRMSMLNRQKNKLNKMRMWQKQSRIDGGFRAKPEYRIRNFDSDMADSKYTNVCWEIEQIQQALNYANVTKTFEVELPDN